MPLPNRVDPFGELFADPARGLFFGNRGGRFHRDDRTLGQRRFVSRCWICCRLAFKGRQRSVWGKGYTELFFLDEVTALAAGHRPCFECRRADAQAFVAAYAAARGLSAPPRAPEFDRVLHTERLDGRAKRRHRLALDDLPDGAFLTLAEESARLRVGLTQESDEAGVRLAPESGIAFAVRGNALLRWTPSGYIARRERPRAIAADVLTPPAILAALSAGYVPRWHPSADG